MTNSINITPETLQKMIAAAVAEALQSKKDEAIASAKEGKSERSIKNEIQTVKAFQKAGFKDVKPHETVMTYNRWLAAGRKVKKGEQSIKVKNLRLFHIDQTEVISPDEKAAELAKMQDIIRKHNDAKAAKAQAEQASA
jgi:N-terminal domain of anti-restriction factor ArdC